MPWKGSSYDNELLDLRNYLLNLRSRPNILEANKSIFQLPTFVERYKE
jgi:hypothetical protein